MTCGIYIIRHRESGREYVGRSVDIQTRWSGHRHDAAFGRKNNYIHNALRKYGSKAFDWVVLKEVNELDLCAAEQECILGRNTLHPAGFNIGGTEGGFPSKALIEAMEPEQREAWKATMRRVSKQGADAMVEKRKDSKYEAAYRAVKSAASTAREANIRRRRAEEPEYDAKERNRRRSAALKNPRTNPAASASTFRERMASNPDFAAQVRANRAKAARVAHAARKLRKEEAENAVVS